MSKTTTAKKIQDKKIQEKKLTDNQKRLKDTAFQMDELLIKIDEDFGKILIYCTDDFIKYVQDREQAIRVIDSFNIVLEAASMEKITYDTTLQILQIDYDMSRSYAKEIINASL